MHAASVFNAATSQWVNAAAIADPSGGTTTDPEARTATIALLEALRDKGVIAGASTVNLGHTWNSSTNQVVLGGAAADPSGGATADAECRTAITSALGVLRSAGVIAGSTSALHTHGFDAGDSRVTTAGSIADVSGGLTVDTECRSAVNAALAAMRSRGLIS